MTKKRLTRRNIYLWSIFLKSLFLASKWAIWRQNRGWQNFSRLSLTPYSRIDNLGRIVAKRKSIRMQDRQIGVGNWSVRGEQYFGGLIFWTAKMAASRDRNSESNFWLFNAKRKNALRFGCKSAQIASKYDDRGFRRAGCNIGKPVPGRPRTGKDSERGIFGIGEWEQEFLTDYPLRGISGKERIILINWCAPGSFLCVCARWTKFWRLPHTAQKWTSFFLRNRITDFPQIFLRVILKSCDKYFSSRFLIKIW